MKDEFTNWYRNEFDRLEADPGPGMWEKISSDLGHNPAHPPKEKKKRRRFLYFLLPLLFIGSCTLVFMNHGTGKSKSGHNPASGSVAALSKKQDSREITNGNVSTANQNKPGGNFNNSVLSSSPSLDPEASPVSASRSATSAKKTSWVHKSASRPLTAYAGPQSSGGSSSSGQDVPEGSSENGSSYSVDRTGNSPNTEPIAVADANRMNSDLVSSLRIAHPAPTLLQAAARENKGTDPVAFYDRDASSNLCYFGLGMNLNNAWLINQETYSGLIRNTLDRTFLFVHPSVTAQFGYYIKPTLVLESQFILNNAYGQTYSHFHEGAVLRKSVLINGQSVALRLKNLSGKGSRKGFSPVYGAKILFITSAWLVDNDNNRSNLGVNRIYPFATAGLEYHFPVAGRWFISTGANTDLGLVNLYPRAGGSSSVDRTHLSGLNFFFCINRNSYAKN